MPFLGSQRFGVVLWSGDICADFDSLRRQIKTGLHVAVSGIPWWTTDIGGFHGGRSGFGGIQGMYDPMVPVWGFLSSIQDARVS
ncbi:TIM-barrel domain-containing protein [Sellimonas intestinalis]|uniref:TIM-barrel domain-containing protein n=1 Tax=Sellimonas intestinalis TaxID=1653434 RepID=UPI003990B478